MKIVIMQPYFIPYAGYFRLFCAADLFVIYDCVQFPRRGWVHRNQLYNTKNELQWLTLPLKKQPMDVAIKDLMFRQESEVEWQEQLNQFETIYHLKKKYPALVAKLSSLADRPVDFIVDSLKEICQIIDLPFNISFSSQLNLSESIRGQDRIIQIVKHFGGTDYINASGGRELYDAEVFLQQGIKLHFLTGYEGEYCSIIESLNNFKPEVLKDILLGQAQLSGESL